MNRNDKNTKINNVQIKSTKLSIGEKTKNKDIINTNISSIIIPAIILVLTFILFIPSNVYARHGDSGFEGGISSGEVEGVTTMDYKEVCFITGQPIEFEGTLIIRKTTRNNIINTTYTYNLKNEKLGATLNRTAIYNTKLVEKSNGQVSEETTLSRTPSEVIRINNITYTLRSNDFSYACIVDSQPSIQYRAGNILSKKVYQVISGTNTGTVTCEIVGDTYAYENSWGSTEAMMLEYIINSRVSNGQSYDEWTGTASISLSTSSIKENRFQENEPDEISFRGGYVESSYNSSVLEYTCDLPEFDSQGRSTHNIKTTKGSLEIETFPSAVRLPVPDINHLRGHWAEEEIKELFSIEIFNSKNAKAFNPEDYITRAEFISAVTRASRQDVSDSSENKRNTVRTTSNNRKRKEEEIVSPFSDVAVDNPYFEDIKNALERKIIPESTDGLFYPEEGVTLSEALVILVRSLGLESLAPNPNAVTAFKDNDLIPEEARSFVYVAHRIGLVHGDDGGYLKPNEKLTKGRTAALIKRYIDYMRSGIRKDYRERILLF
ncbi:MAG TPA: S-layer homology domain-containing protein [Clostridiaceae bacterium]|nr:S-layer homology domain-containing protein [Clostridiaceae bacterium]